MICGIFLTVCKWNFLRDWLLLKLCILLLSHADNEAFVHFSQCESSAVCLLNLKDFKTVT